MRLRTLALVLVALLFVGSAASASAQTNDRDKDGVADAHDACQYQAGVPRHDGCPGPYVVHSKTVRPKRHVRRVHHFQPESTPTATQVHKIEDLEQARWGGPTLRNRVWCESGDRWYAANGQYHGLLQIGTWWSYVWPKTPRGVRLTSHDKRPAAVYRVKVYDTGKRVHKRVGSRSQRVTRVKKGKIAANASAYNGWAAIRVGQRAVSGDGPSASWECPL